MNLGRYRKAVVAVVAAIAEAVSLGLVPDPWNNYAAVIVAAAAAAGVYVVPNTVKAVRHPVTHREPVKVDHGVKPRIRRTRRARGVDGGYGVLELVILVLVVFLLVWVLLRATGTA